MKPKPKREKRKYEREILLETFRRVFGTDSPSASIACERPTTRRLVDRVYDSIVCERATKTNEGDRP